MAWQKSSSGSSLLPWLGIALAVILLDQFTKTLILGYFQLGDSRSVTSFFNVVRVHNTGAAFSFLAGASVVRARRYADAFAEDFAHPVRHPFVAAIPISVILLATASVALEGPSTWARAVWWTGSVAQLVVTAWVLVEASRIAQLTGLVWAGLGAVVYVARRRRWTPSR